MRKFVCNHAVIIAVSMSFFIFGLVLGVGVFDLSSENILAVVIGGAACGVTVLLLEVHSGIQTGVLRFAILARLARSKENTSRAASASQVLWLPPHSQTEH
jgi:hypothetical protein